MVKPNGMARCPFHDDRHPSMRIYDNHRFDSRYVCFGCGENGDVIDFTAKLFGLRPIEAAKKLARDFGITADCVDNTVLRKIRSPTEDVSRTFRILSNYIKLLEEWRTEYKPKSPDDEVHPRFITASTQLDKLRYLQDVFISGTKEEQIQLSKELKEELNEFEREQYGRGNACGLG